MATAQFNLVPGGLDIQGVVGDDFSLLFDFNIDLTGYTFDARVIFQNAPRNTYETFTILETNLAEGRITLALTDVQTKNLGPLSNAKWYISWFIGSSTRTVISGKFSLNQPWAVGDISPTTSPVSVVVETDTIDVTVIGGSGGIVLWGDIQGDIEDQTDLIEYLEENYQSQINLCGNGAFLIPSEGTLSAFGDSQTYGGNSAAGPEYTDGVRLYPQYRWPNILATMRTRNLNVVNYATGAQKLSWNLSYPNSVFNQMGQHPINWTGISVVMGGWNNLDGGMSHGDEFYNVMQGAYEACIARLLIEDYAGLSVFGWSRTSNSTGQYGWSTDGGNTDTGDIDNRAIPFKPDWAPEIFQRHQTFLEPSKYLEFSLSDKEAIALFLETSSDGIDFNVLVNGTNIYSGTTDYNNSGGSDQGSYPIVIWLHNLELGSSTIRIETSSTGGTLLFNAFGWINRDVNLLSQRSIILGTVIANQAGSPPIELNTLWRTSNSAQNASAGFYDYPVGFSNPFNHWINSTDQQVGDLPHITPIGNIHVANAFDGAQKSTGVSSLRIIDVKKSNLEINTSGTNTGDQYGGVTASGASQYLRRNGANSAYEFGTLPPSAPEDATYIVQTASSGLSNEQALGALATGIVKNTTSTGVLSIAVAGTDYLAPSGNGSSLTGLTAQQIAGTTTNNNADAGDIGEFVSSLVASGSAVSLSDGVSANVTSISLTAGDWDVEGSINFIGSVATISNKIAGISSTSATLPTDGSEVYSGVQMTLLTATDGITLPRKRISISGTTTVYLVAQTSFSAGTVTAFGGITARRPR